MLLFRIRSEEYAAEVGALLFETSAKDNLGVSEVFHNVSEEVVKLRGEELRSGGGTPGGEQHIQSSTGGIRVNNGANSAPPSEADSGCC